MSEHRIRDLPRLLNSKLGPHKILKETKISNLMEKGENYGSTMLKLDFTIETDKGQTETLYAVAKMLPESEVFRKVFHIQVTYPNEMAFYEIVVPTLQNFQRELGIENVIDCFAKCFATRRNLLMNNDEIDEDAIIVLENLKAAGFENIERTVGFDLETTKLLLNDLAHIHGVSLALKLKKPKVFEDSIKPYCAYFKPSHQELLPVLKRIIEENEDIAHLASKLVAWGTNALSPINEPFATLIHRDTWTNNTMQKFENGKAVANRFVDFQFYDYGSPAADMFFLIFSSIPLDILEPNLDYFLKYYHEHFICVLERHGCDVSPFSYDLFLKEMNSVSEYEFPHAFLFHNLVVNAVKGQNLENPDIQQIIDTVPLKVKQKSWYMVKECYNRGWFK